MKFAAAGWTLLLLLCLSVGSALAAQPDLMVKLASEPDSSYVGGGIIETTALTQSRSQPAFPGVAAIFHLLLKNAGTTAGTFVLHGGASGSGFTVRYRDAGGTDRTGDLTGAGYTTGSMAPGESVTLYVEVLPASINPGASYRVAVSAASASDPGSVDQVKTETVACNSTAAVLISSPPDMTGPPGSVVYYPYTVTNVGNETNTFALSPSGSNGWGTVLFVDDGAGGGVAGDGIRQSGESTVTATTGPLAPGASYHFFLAVTLPQGAVNGARGDVRVTAAGNGATGVDAVTTTAMAATLTVAENVRNLTQGGVFATAANAYPGDTLEFRMSITNSGSTAATGVTIEAPISQGLPLVAGSLKFGTTAGGDGAACAVADCGFAQESAGNIVARLGQGATDSTGGMLNPGKTLYVYYRVKVE